MWRATGFQFLKFSFVGVLNTAIQYAVFLVLLRVASVHYLAASLIGYICGLGNSYVLNRRWTFAAAGSSDVSELSRFVVVNAAALAVNAGVLYLLVSRAGVAAETGQVVAIAFSMCVNFFGNRFWTFGEAAAL